MGKSTSVKREIRFQQWIQQVKEYNERPDGMSMSAWCKTRGIAQSTFATRLQKVQDRCLESCQISAESSELSVSSEPAMPAFVELPVTKYSCEDKPAAVISCPNFKIEISEFSTRDLMSEHSAGLVIQQRPLRLPQNNTNFSWKASPLLQSALSQSLLTRLEPFSFVQYVENKILHYGAYLIVTGTYPRTEYR